MPRRHHVASYCFFGAFGAFRALSRAVAHRCATTPNSFGNVSSSGALSTGKSRCWLGDVRSDSGALMAQFALARHSADLPAHADRAGKGARRTCSSVARNSLRTGRLRQRPFRLDAAFCAVRDGSRRAARIAERDVPVVTWLAFSSPWQRQPERWAVGGAGLALGGPQSEGAQAAVARAARRVWGAQEAQPWQQRHLDWPRRPRRWVRTRVRRATPPQAGRKDRRRGPSARGASSVLRGPARRGRRRASRGRLRRRS